MKSDDTACSVIFFLVHVMSVVVLIKPTLQTSL